MKAKLIATSGICGAVATVCLLLVGVPGVNYFALVLAVISSVAVSMPLLLSPDKGLQYSLLTCFVSGVLGVTFGIANIVFVAPTVLFCMPFAITKVYCESVKLTASIEGEKTLDDPFGQGDDKKVVALNINTKPRVSKVVKWIIYYVLLEISLVATFFATKLLTPAVHEIIITNGYVWWLAGACQVFVILYDLLLRGVFVATIKTINKVNKP